MKNTKRTYLLSSLLLAVTMSASSLIAQEFVVNIGNPDFDDIPSPDVGGNTDRKSFKPKDWLEVEVQFNIKSKNRELDFADNVNIKWYIAVKITEGGKTSVRVLEKDVKYVNVPLDEDVYASVYLSPSAVKRISGAESAGKSLVEAVGGEMTVNGTQPAKHSGIFTTLAKSKGKWWDSAVRYSKIPLLNKSETPFKFLWWDRYAEIEEKS